MTQQKPLLIICSFQSLNGAIKSNMPYSHAVAVTLFQFLNGAIKRMNGELIDLAYEPFQFLNGAIKSIALSPEIMYYK